MATPWVPVIHECFSFKIFQEVAIKWKEKKKEIGKEEKKKYISSVKKNQ